MMPLRGFQNVPRELSSMSALFDEGELVRSTEHFPHPGKLRGEQPAEERPDADIREVIASPSERGAPGAVVAARRMIERLLHKFRERDRTGATNFFAKELDEIWIARQQTGTSSAQRETSNAARVWRRGSSVEFAVWISGQDT